MEGGGEGPLAMGRGWTVRGSLAGEAGEAQDAEQQGGGAAGHLSHRQQVGEGEGRGGDL